jgi:hypothetical protein
VVGACIIVTAPHVARAQQAPATAPVGAGPTVNRQSLTENTQANSPVDQFAGPGQLAISSDAALSIANTSLSGGKGSTTTFQFAPAVDYFVIRNLSLGGSVLFSYSSAGSGHSTLFGIGPRAGYNFPLSDLVSVWPKAGMSISSTTQTIEVVNPVNNTTSSNSTSNTAIALNLFVPLMFHPAPHFFAGFGPFLDADLSGDAKATTFGGKLTLGGWLPL